MLSVLFGSEKISCQLQRVIEVDKLSVVNICICICTLNGKICRDWYMYFNNNAQIYQS